MYIDELGCNIKTQFPVHLLKVPPEGNESTVVRARGGGKKKKRKQNDE